jgi:dihydrofolate reductase
MGRLIVSNIVSLDGYVSGPKGELDWFVSEGFMDEEFGDHAKKLISSIDGILLGRRTYEEFVSYWPGVTSDDDVIAVNMNALPKFVFSSTLDKVPWGKHKAAKLVRGDAVKEVRRIKKQFRGDLALYGSGKLVSTLMKAGLVDELQLLVKPIVLGKGRPEFVAFTSRYKLKLLRAVPLKNGDVMLFYEPAGKKS